MIKANYKKLVRYESHFAYLEACLHDDILKGFSWRWRMCLDADPEYLEKSEKIKRDAQIKLTQLTKDAAAVKINQIQGSLVCKNTVISILGYVDSLRGKLARRKGNKLKSLQEAQFSRAVVGTSRNTFNTLSSRTAKMLQEKFGIESEYKLTGKQLDSTCKVGDKVCINVQDDGNCFYRCISKFLTDIEDYHLQIRRKVTKHMRDNQDIYLAYVDGNYEEHVENQSAADGSLQSWATEAQIYAVSSITGCQIKVATQNSTLCYSPLTDFVKNGVDIHLWYDQDHFKLLIPIHNHGHNKCGQQELAKETAGVESRELQIDRSDAEENYCWFEMSGGGQRKEPELEKGQKKESKRVKGKLRKIWKKQSDSRKNDETYADKETSDLVTMQFVSKDINSRTDKSVIQRKQIYTK